MYISEGLIYLVLGSAFVLVFFFLPMHAMYKDGGWPKVLEWCLWIYGGFALLFGAPFLVGIALEAYTSLSETPAFWIGVGCTWVPFLIWREFADFH